MAMPKSFKKYVPYVKPYVRRSVPYILGLSVLTVLVVVGYFWLHRPELPSVPRGKPITKEKTPHPPLSQQYVQVGQLSPRIDQLTRKVLLNIREHGWNPAAKTRGRVTGGLFVNWKMDDPSQTNALKQGINEATADKHDPQVELYYLNALAQYKVLHPQDTQFDHDLQKALSLVKSAFANYNVPKGWIYFFLLRTGLLLHDTDLQNKAYIAAQHYYANWYDPKIGVVYNRRAHPGNFNVEHTLNCGAALIDAGMRWNQPDWVQAGKSTIDHTIDVALNKQYSMLYNEMLVLPNEQLEVKNSQAKPSTQGNSVFALVTAYNLTHQQRYLDVAGLVLRSMFASSLWDQVHGGLFFALDMNGGKLERSYKETRGQTLSLVGLYAYNQALRQQGKPQQLLDKQQKLIAVLCNHFYQSTYHGFFYRVTPTFDVYVSRPGVGIGVEDFFTTEAMGTAMDALQRTEFARLPF